MKEKLYQLLASRSPAGQERYQALRLSGTPRWRAAPALLRGAFSRRESGRPTTKAGRSPPLSIPGIFSLHVWG